VSKPNVNANEYINKLTAFRQSAYACLGTARDALFELSDAVLLTPGVQSLAELSESPAFRRRWPSLYAALSEGQVDRAALGQLYLGWMTADSRPVLAGDHTAWPRPYARTLPERTVEHQPTAIPGAKPITVGQGYSTLAWVPEASGSWALPFLHERITSHEKPRQVAARQLRAISRQLTVRAVACFDAEYGCAPFVRDTADLPCDKLLRLRPNLVLYTAPPPYSGHGRPPRHGRKFRLGDGRTWGQPDETLSVQDPDWGEVQVRQWSGLHFKKAAAQVFWVLRLERLEARGTRREPRVLWLAWLGEPPPPLAEGWRLYFRRFALEHWYRFAKQSLFWTLPRLQTPAAAERWSDLMPFLTWQLWLARPAVKDRPRPWQKSCATLSPGRVRQSLAALFAQLGTPAQAPKLRGKSAGWPVGRKRSRRPRWPVVKKR
jgi:hypothetical protein